MPAKRRAKTAPKTTKKTTKKPAKFTKAKHAVATPMGSSRADKGQPAQFAIDRMPELSRAIARAADRLIRECVPDAQGVVKWGNAVYTVGTLAFASIIQTRQGVNLALPGAALSDPHKLLQGTGKVMRHVKLHDLAAVAHPGVRDLVLASPAIGIKGM